MVRWSRTSRATACVDHLFVASNYSRCPSIEFPRDRGAYGQRNSCSPRPTRELATLCLSCLSSPLPSYRLERQKHASFQNSTRRYEVTFRCGLDGITVRATTARLRASLRSSQHGSLLRIRGSHTISVRRISAREISFHRNCPRVPRKTIISCLGS